MEALRGRRGAVLRALLPARRLAAGRVRAVAATAAGAEETEEADARAAADTAGARLRAHRAAARGRLAVGGVERRQRRGVLDLVERLQLVDRQRFRLDDRLCLALLEHRDTLLLARGERQRVDQVAKREPDR